MADLDVLVLGSGVAGLSAAVRAARSGLSVGVISKAELSQTTTRWAQGGVAAALSGDPEETDLHLADTLKAGGGLCDIDAVRVLVDEGPTRVNDLIALGAMFDRDESGRLELATEGGHSVARIVHAGGAATGAEVERALVVAVRASAAALHERTFAHTLTVEDGRVVGVAADDDQGHPLEVRARHVILATGGAGQLFAVTTNPPAATGDGVAMALRVGAAVADLEFFQFHPTALALPTMPRALLSEALRGHGALLRDDRGERFVDELKPRDVVSRAIHDVMMTRGLDHVWLDARGLDHFDLRFPTIHRSLVEAGFDPAVDLLPVAPAAHHQCGGVVTDLDGHTSLRGLWAAGETTCTGVHGANRLASNSLLEGMVFGARTVDAILDGVDAPTATGAMRAVLGHAPDEENVIDGIRLDLAVPPAADDTPGVDTSMTPEAVAEVRAALQRTMTAHVGVGRDAEGLTGAVETVGELLAQLPRHSSRPDANECRNLAEIAWALSHAALSRTESRGCHTRVDHPKADEAQRHRIVVAG